MSQGEPGVELNTSLGYMLKAAASALHSALEAVLRPLGMTITHYACLELLAQRPGLSNSELARGAGGGRRPSHRRPALSDGGSSELTGRSSRC